MNITNLFSAYVALQILISISYGCMTFYTWVTHREASQSSARQNLKLHYILLGFVLCISLLLPYIPHKNFFEPVVKVWSAETLHSFSNQYSNQLERGYVSIPGKDIHTQVDNTQLSDAAIILFLCLLLFVLFSITKELKILLKIKNRSQQIKKIGRVYIYTSSDISIPYSYWTPGHSNVVIPESTLDRGNDFRITLSHELQHHRQHDTQWVYVILFLRIICFLNPFFYLWNRQISEAQEFACDEALVDQHKVEAQQYARCLIQIAETAIHQKHLPACATGLLFLIDRNLLKRRIVMMTTKTKKAGSKLAITMGATTILLMVATAIASQGLIQDRRITKEAAQQIASKTNRSSDFPLVVNDLVLKQLNRYMGTPDGRDFIKSSIQRMKNHEPTVNAKIVEYSVPSELKAVPLVESGYQNLADQGLASRGAGLWMFIASTAKNFGLTVNNPVDERLDIELETDAAMRYLKSNHLQFKDWSLALLAYNMGENAVAKAIQKTGSRDAWILIKHGYEGDKDYLPKIMAAIILMKNPDLLN